MFVLVDGNACGWIPKLMVSVIVTLHSFFRVYFKMQLPLASIPMNWTRQSAVKIDL